MRQSDEFNNAVQIILNELSLKYDIKKISSIKIVLSESQDEGDISDKGFIEDVGDREISVIENRYCYFDRSKGRIVCIPGA